MLFLVTGASGSGKTACLPMLKELMPEIVWFDFDDFGVPENADKVWRQKTTEKWLQKASELQADGKDTGLNGNVIFGEVLACPSAEKIAEIKACLLDCRDVKRIERLRKRDAHGATQEMLCWAAWQRMHCAELDWRPDVIQDESWSEMRWENWKNKDNYPLIETIDTTDLSIKEVAESIIDWMKK